MDFLIFLVPTPFFLGHFQSIDNFSYLWFIIIKKGNNMALKLNLIIIFS